MKTCVCFLLCFYNAPPPNIHTNTHIAYYLFSSLSLSLSVCVIVSLSVSEKPTQNDTGQSLDPPMSEA